MDEGGAVVVADLAEVGASFAEQVGGSAEGPTRGAFDEQVVGGDVEGFGEFDDDVDRRADLPFSLRLIWPASPPTRAARCALGPAPTFGGP